MAHVAIAAIVALSVLLMLVRPRDWPEAWWVCGGASLLVLARLVPVRAAAHAVGDGADVYAFLVGMMVLSELARSAGVFDWLAAAVVRRAQGSGVRLFTLLYGAGVLVTVFLSNDATAVVLTPAVIVAVRRAKAPVLPHAFACALVANAASFVLPISNPANLVLYRDGLPALGTWLATYALPSLGSIVATFVVLRLWFGRELRQPIETTDAHSLSLDGRVVIVGLALVVGVLTIASACGWALGMPTLLASAFVALVVCARRGSNPVRLLAHVSWSTLALVAGLFVLVEGVRGLGAIERVRELLVHAQAMPYAHFLAGGAIALANNVLNNLPTGLLVGDALRGLHSPLTRAALIGVDLGPNLAVTGSLATILWLLALRREGERVGFFDFSKLGAVAMPVALAAALALLALT